MLGRCRSGLLKQAALRDQPQSSKRDKADGDIRAGKKIRRQMCDRASVAVADHSDRRDGKRRGAESEVPIGYGKRLLHDPGQQAEQQERLQQSVSHKGMSDEVGDATVDAEIGDRANRRRSELDAQGRP